MKQFYTSLLALFFVTSMSAQLTQHSMTVGTETRNYYKYLPVGYQATENLPLVFILHGLGGNALQMTAAGFAGISDTARIIAIYPDALPNALGQTAWNNGTLASSAANDIGFFNKMMDKMILEQNVNASRIYVTGFSMGGIMSHHLSCAINNRIAAIGPMAGTMSSMDIATCTPTYKTPVIHLHGTADPTVPYNSNPLPSLSLVPETMSFWRNVHGCATTADSIRLPDTAADGYTVDRFIYDNCTPSKSVELWRINGGVHDYLYEPVNDITEGKEVWRFFYKWQHPNPATVSLSDLVAENSFVIAPNPSKGNVKIEAKEAGLFYLSDVSGKIIEKVQITYGTNEFTFDLTQGIYFLADKNGNAQRLVIQ